MERQIKDATLPPKAHTSRSRKKVIELNENESDDEETKEQILQQAREMVIRKTQMLEDNPLERFKPDDDFDFSEETTDNPEPEPQLSFSEWLWSKVPPAPDVWRTSGDREALKWCKNAKRNPFLKCFPNSCLRVFASRKSTNYSGHLSESDAKHGVGVCQWPEPPFGEGQSYYGSWRDNSMHGHGVLAFFDGDVYLGLFDQGEYHGYGVYKYSDAGAWKGDIYEGRYYKGMRQGSGVYYYIADETTGKQGAVYIGEWIRGAMQGLGILTCESRSVL
jgi:hypothetical protein